MYTNNPSNHPQFNIIQDEVEFWKNLKVLATIRFREIFVYVRKYSIELQGKNKRILAVSQCLVIIVKFLA